MKKEFLDLAIKYAYKAYRIKEVPVGAVIVKDNEIIGFGYNKNVMDRKDRFYICLKKKLIQRRTSW